jgi:hypothetical protein
VSAAYVDSFGDVVKLDGRADVPINVTADDVQDADKLARMLQTALREIAMLRRRWNPDVLFFRDRTVDATAATKYRLAHQFAGRVNWYVAKWDPTVAGTEVRLDEHADTDENTLVLVSAAAGVVTIKVEAAG